MATATVRIPAEKRDILRIIAGVEGTGMKEILSGLIDEYIERHKETLELLSRPEWVETIRAGSARSSRRSGASGSMSWLIEVRPSAEQQYSRLDRDTRRRIKNALADLEGCERPFLHPHMRPPSGRFKGDYRPRIGGWRALITPEVASSVLHVYAILPRDDAY